VTGAAIRGTPNERLWQPGRGRDPAPAPVRAGADPRCCSGRRSRAELSGARCRQAASVATGTDLRAWLFTLLHNQHVNDVRRSVREGINVSIEDAAPVLTIQPNAIDVLQLRDLEKALGQLAQEQRQVILLIGMEGMTYEDAASLLGVPIGTVRSRLSRGRDQLRNLMGMGDEISGEPVRDAVRVARQPEACLMSATQ